MMSALVDYKPGSDFNVIRSWALQDAREPGVVGIGHGDAVQLVTGLAVQQAAIARPFVAKLALYDQKLAFVGTELATTEEIAALINAGTFPIFMVGEPEEPADAYRRKLVLALEGCLMTIKEAKEGGAPEFESITVLLPLAAIAVIVAGVAASVIGSTVAWRYLDPSARRQIESVHSAGDAYTKRLEEFRASGTMPPASEMEKSAAKAVETMAGKAETNGWLWAAGGAGVAFVAVGIAWIGSRRAA